MSREKANQKAQILIFVFFLMIIMGVFAAGISTIWQPEVLTRSYMRDGDYAFYLAQAGIERAKVELFNNWDYSDTPHTYTLGDGTYAISFILVSGISPNERQRITSTGTVRSCVRTVGLDIDQSGRSGTRQVCVTVPSYCCWDNPAVWNPTCTCAYCCFDAGCGTTCDYVCEACGWVGCWVAQPQTCATDAAHCGTQQSCSPETYYYPGVVDQTWKEK